ncbi:MAG TPA: pilus assembly protein PilM [Candidatus Limnocylindrales bacterium]|jgi:Tfp pilus assembly PilM family ATPase|nr:pilus assembly protein PilM [Candidatus Limnocylindrales bacterium]
MRTQPKIDRMRPPVRRVLAVDGGNRRLKLLLAESDFGRFRLLQQDMLDLQAEGLVSPEELKTHLQQLLKAYGRPPLALTLPQHVAISQVIDLPQTAESDVEKLIAEESVKLGGVTDSRIIYDFVRIETPSYRQQYWVTICQEGDVRDRILKLGVEKEEICEITTVANALVAAYRASAPDSGRAILVHCGAQTTVLVVLLAGQGAFATSFHMGGDFLTRALARLHDCSEEAAETLKRDKNFLTGPQASGEFIAVVEGWAAELKRQLNEWFQANPTLVAEVATFKLVASGGGFEMPGLLPFLKSHAELSFQPWPRETQPDAVAPGKGFEVAFGTALQALGYSPQPVSLLPEDYRLAWRKRLGRQRIEVASAVLVALCALLLGMGTWHKLSLISTKKALLDKVRAGQRAFDENESLTEDLLNEYENLRPLCAAQQSTLDTLKTVALLEQSRSNRPLWYVLIADQQSYFTMPPALLSTNRPAKTNLIGAALEAARATPLGLRPFPSVLTNSSPARPGLIAELCVPGDSETTRQALSELVNNLKQQLLFSKVDLLSDDLRRSLADPKVTVPDRYFVLSLDFAQTDFQQPIRYKKTTGSDVLRPNKRPNRTSSTPEVDPGMSQIP